MFIGRRSYGLPEVRVHPGQPTSDEVSAAQNSTTSMLVSLHGLTTKLPGHATLPTSQSRRPAVPKYRQYSELLQNQFAKSHKHDPDHQRHQNHFFSGNRTLRVTTLSPTISSSQTKLLKSLKQKIINIQTAIIAFYNDMVALFRTDCQLLLSLMFVDVLVNTAMITLNYTTLVIDFFDEHDWNISITSSTTSKTKFDALEFEPSLKEQSGGKVIEQYYAQFLSDRKHIVQRLNTFLFVIVYLAQVIGCFGIVRHVESLLHAYLSFLAIQLVVLSFSVVIRPFWLPLCLLRFALFSMTLKRCLELSDRNVNQVWAFTGIPQNHSKAIDDYLIRRRLQTSVQHSMSTFIGDDDHENDDEDDHANYASTNETLKYDQCSKSMININEDDVNNYDEDDDEKN